MKINQQLQWDKEEISNLVTHGLGAIASAIGLGYLLYFAFNKGGIWEQVSFGLFGITMLIVFLASTIYHTIRTPKWKRIFQTIDQSAIFLLIAGSYAPFCLVSMRGVWGWSILSVVWALAITGICLKFYFKNRMVKPFVFWWDGCVWLQFRKWWKRFLNFHFYLLWLVVDFICLELFSIFGKNCRTIMLFGIFL